MFKLIHVITTTRAEYGLLRPFIKYLKINYKTKLIVSGTHLETKWGLTKKEIDFPIDYEIPMFIEKSGDNPAGICKTLIYLQSGLTNIFSHEKPDLLVLLGDRYEILGIAQIAHIFSIPICHLAGGDTTEGAIDNNIRHCVSKLSRYHLPFSNESAKKLIQLDIPENNIFPIQNPGITEMLEYNYLSKSELFQKLNIPDKEFNILTIYHPETLLDEQNQKSIIKNLFETINKFEDIQFIFILPNCDTYSSYIFEEINKINHPKFTSLSRIDYLNLMKVCNLTLGNSSSGIYETPYFNKYTINIGDRQKGRLCSNSVIHIPNSLENLENIIKEYVNKPIENISIPFSSTPFYNVFDKFNTKNKEIYIIGGGGNAKVIVDIIEESTEYKIAGFYDDKPTQLYNYKYLGKIENISPESNVVCTIGNIKVRKQLTNKNCNYPTLIHKSANISKTARIGKGTIIYKNVNIQPDVVIGDFCLINTSANIDHESIIGNYCNINPNVTLCGNVKIKDNCFIGASTTIIQGINIEKDVIVGAGSIIIRDIPEKTKIVGNPGKEIPY